MNRTKIEWTPKLIAEQLKRNAEREQHIRVSIDRAATTQAVEQPKVKTAKKQKPKPPRKKKKAFTPRRRERVPRQTIPHTFENMIVKGRPRPLPRSVSEIVKEQGFVYLIECSGLYKIGMTRNIPTRMQDLARKWRMDNYTIIHVITSDDMIYLEAALHRRFADKCAHAEWFRLQPADVAWIVGLGNTVNAWDMLRVGLY